MNRPLRWVGLLLACLLGAGGYYVWSKATPYDEVVDRGPSPEALANPYLAAEHFLRQQGLTVEHAYNLKQLDTLPSKGNSLLLLGERSNMSPRQVEQLLEWARSGGHLLLVLAFHFGMHAPGERLRGFFCCDAYGAPVAHIYKRRCHLSPITKFQSTLAETAAGNDAHRIRRTTIYFDKSHQTLAIGAVRIFNPKLLQS